MIPHDYALERNKMQDGSVDLLSAFITMPDISDLPEHAILDWIRIDEHSEMRLDTIVERVYGSLNDFDLVRSLNKIRNPHALKIGDVIALPNIAVCSKLTKLRNYQFRRIERDYTQDIDVSKTVLPNSNKTNSKTVKINNGIITFSK